MYYNNLSQRLDVNQDFGNKTPQSQDSHKLGTGNFGNNLSSQKDRKSSDAR
jgi:hypothetical protein